MVSVKQWGIVCFKQLGQTAGGVGKGWVRKIILGRRGAQLTTVD